MASQDLLRRVATLYFEQRRTREEIAEILHRDGFLRSTDPKPVKKLFEEAGQWLLAEERNHSGSRNSEKQEITAAAFFLKGEYPHLKDVFMPNSAHPHWPSYDHLDGGICGEAARFFVSLLDRADDYQEELHVLIGGGQTLANVWRRLGSRVSSKAHFYPAAVVGRPRTLHGSPLGPEANAVIGWTCSGSLEGHLHYLTVAPPDIEFELLEYKGDDQRHAAACRLLCEDTAEQAKNKPIKAMLNHMEKANAAMSGFGLISLPSEGEEPTPMTKIIGKGPPTEVPGHPTAFQSRTVYELLQTHGVKLDKLIEDGAVGEFAYCLFDKDGNGRKEWEFFLTPGYPNSVQFYKDMVAEGNTVIGIGNLATLPAIDAAVRGKIINVLITDLPTAKELLPEKYPNSAASERFVARARTEAAERERAEAEEREIERKHLEQGGHSESD